MTQIPLFTHPFFEHKHADLYWQALVQVAKGNKTQALEAVTALRNDVQLTNVPCWKENKPAHIEDYFDKLLIATVCRDPQLLSRLGLLETVGIYEHNAYLNDLSIQALVAGLEETKHNLQILQQYTVNDLSYDNQISYKIFSWMLKHTIAGENFLFHTYYMNQLDSVLRDLITLLTQHHKLETQQDLKNYMVRLTKIPTQFDQVVALLELQKNKGIVMPRFVIEKVITILEKSLPKDPREHIFYTHLVEHTAALSIPEKSVLLEQALRVIGHEVYPACYTLREYFVTLLQTATTNYGVWALPDGDAYYAHMLRYHTTTNLTADEIHAIGLREVAQIHEQMRLLLQAEGRVVENKNIGELVQELAREPQFYYPNTDAGRAACLADYTKILERSRKELGHLFNIKPRAGVEIQRVPEYEEDGAPAAYYRDPSADGTRPGVFFANLRGMSEIPTYGMETLTIHEAEPGHHFQVALQYEMNIPMLRKLGFYTAYVEGWALYTEKLAYEHDFYSSSFSKLGHLQDELLRAVRLVVDTGIHYKRWTREQAIEYMKEATGYHHNTVVTEVERYFVLPGQACAYKIGQLKILELRKHAQDTLGEKFDIKEFHDVILKTAAVPLTILEEVVEHYIQEKQNL